MRTLVLASPGSPPACAVSGGIWTPSPVSSCGTVIDLDLTVKRRDPDAPIRIMTFSVCAAMVTVTALRGIEALSVDLTVRERNRQIDLILI
jgi:hypothetical protein